ncbi:MAG: hypothetical protein ABSE58_05940 [Candidatus Limnocylindrales bacterium]|jgi:hypothetical protein
MTGTPGAKASPTTLADLPSPYPVFTLAAIGLVAGYWWFPAWFLSAQLLRIWSVRGGIAWLSSRGVPEYTDDRYAAFIGYAPLALIAVRIVLSFNWLEPFQVFANQKVPTGSDAELGGYLAIVLGAAVAAALTGVLRTHGPAWLLAAAGFSLVLALAIGSNGAVWRPNALTALPLVLVGYLVSKIPMTAADALTRWAERRTGRTEE